VRQLPLFASLVPGVTMHTTGLGGETMGGLYEGERLAQRLRDARAHARDLLPISTSRTLRVPCIPIVNPPLWELAHIAWFQEFWCLRGASGRAPLDPRGRRRALQFEHRAARTRWTLAYPPTRRLRYMDATLEATLERARRRSRAERYFFTLALCHEDMHGEALLMTLQTLGLPAPVAAACAAAPPRARPRRRRLRRRRIPAGHAPSARFVFDNEKWRHRSRVERLRDRSRP
jgi:iron(II)-dependent oxidoreductase